MQHRAGLIILAVVLAGTVVGPSSASPCEKHEYSVGSECKDCSNTQAKDDYLQKLEDQENKLTTARDALKSEDDAAKPEYDQAKADRDTSGKEANDFSKQMANIEKQLERATDSAVRDQLGKKWGELRQKRDAAHEAHTSAKANVDKLLQAHNARKNELNKLSTRLKSVKAAIGRTKGEYWQACLPCPKGLQRDFATGECKDPCGRGLQRDAAGECKNACDKGFKCPPGRICAGVCR